MDLKITNTAILTAILAAIMKMWKVVNLKIVVMGSSTPKVYY